KADFFKDIHFYEQEFDGVLPVEIVIDTERKNGVLKLSTLKKMDQLGEIIKEIPELSPPISIVNMVKYSKQAFYGGLPKYYQMPTSQESSFIMNVVRKSSDKGNLLKSFVDSTGQTARMTTFMKDIETDRMEQVKDKLLESINTIFP